MKSHLCFAGILLKISSRCQRSDVCIQIQNMETFEVIFSSRVSMVSPWSFPANTANENPTWLIIMRLVEMSVEWLYELSQVNYR